MCFYIATLKKITIALPIFYQKIVWVIRKKAVKLMIKSIFKWSLKLVIFLTYGLNFVRYDWKNGRNWCIDNSLKW